MTLCPQNLKNSSPGSDSDAPQTWIMIKVTPLQKRQLYNTKNFMDKLEMDKSFCTQDNHLYVMFKKRNRVKPSTYTSLLWEKAQIDSSCIVKPPKKHFPKKDPYSLTISQDIQSSTPVKFKYDSNLLISSYLDGKWENLDLLSWQNVIYNYLRIEAKDYNHRESFWNRRWVERIWDGFTGVLELPNSMKRTLMQAEFNTFLQGIKIPLINEDTCSLAEFKLHVQYLGLLVNTFQEEKEAFAAVNLPYLKRIAKAKGFIEDPSCSYEIGVLLLDECTISVRRMGELGKEKVEERKKVEVEQILKASTEDFKSLKFEDERGKLFMESLFAKEWGLFYQNIDEKEKAKEKFFEVCRYARELKDIRQMIRGFHFVSGLLEKCGYLEQAKVVTSETLLVQQLLFKRSDLSIKMQKSLERIDSLLERQMWSEMEESDVKKVRM